MDTIDKIWAMALCFVIGLCLFVFVGFGIGSSSNLDYVKDHAEERWEELGFKMIGYDGFNWGMLGYGTSYGGAKVWYVLKRIPDNGLTYGGYLQRWGNEIHMYNLRTYDAIRPN